MLADRRKLPFLLAALSLAIMAGCRGTAQREVYDAQMAHEIRVLEDQLYEADYQNRILIDKIESLKLKSSAPFHQNSSQDSDETPRNRPSLPIPVRPEIQPSPNSNYLPVPSNKPVLENMNDLDAIIDDGQQEPLMPAPPSIENLELPAPNSSPSDDNAIPSRSVPVTPSETKTGSPESPNDDNRLGFLPASSPYSTQIARSEPLLAAPGGPEPPGRNSLIAPPLIRGEMLPPPGKNPEPMQPPGQIVLPDSPEVPAAEQLKLHSSLSGGTNHHGETNQILLVVNVLDENGRPLKLANYDVNGDLAVVLFDGDTEQSDSTRLGRWDFTPQEVLSFIKDEPVSGFHIPLQLDQVQPQQKVVQAHVRLRSEEDEMRCNGTIQVSRENATALWAPRADSTPTSR